MVLFPLTVRVVCDYNAIYSDPIFGNAGMTVSCVRRDPENPSWIWCVCPKGRQGWVHEGLLDFETSRLTARLVEDCSAIELSVVVGDELTANYELSGWYFCENLSGNRGWLPKENVELV